MTDFARNKDQLEYIRLAEFHANKAKDLKERLEQAIEAFVNNEPGAVQINHEIVFTEIMIEVGIANAFIGLANAMSNIKPKRTHLFQVPDSGDDPENYEDDTF